jgi:hypothetical protein
MTKRGGPTRTKEQREYDLQEVSNFYLQGWIQAAIAKHLNKTRTYEITQQTVSNDIKAIQKRWLASSIRDFDDLRAQELAKIDNLERTYWLEYEASKDPVIKRKTAKKVDGQTTEATQEVGQGTGDPRFLQGVQWCIDRRVKLLGLDGPTRSEITGKDGGPIEMASIDLNTLTDDQIKRLAAGEDVAAILANE